MQINVDLALQTLAAPRKTAIPLLSGSFRLAGMHAQNFRVGMLLMAVLILNAVDLMYTLFAYRIQQMTELNPLAETFFAIGRTNSLVCYKLLMVGCGCGMLWRLRHSRWAVPACWVLLAAYIVLSIVWLVWVRNINYSYETMMLTMTPVREYLHR